MLPTTLFQWLSVSGACVIEFLHHRWADGFSRAPPEFSFSADLVLHVISLGDFEETLERETRKSSAYLSF